MRVDLSIGTIVAEVGRYAICVVDCQETNPVNNLI